MGPLCVYHSFYHGLVALSWSRVVPVSFIFLSKVGAVDGPPKIQLPIFSFLQFSRTINWNGYPMERRELPFGWAFLIGSAFWAEGPPLEFPGNYHYQFSQILVRFVFHFWVLLWFPGGIFTGWGQARWEVGPLSGIFAGWGQARWELGPHSDRCASIWNQSVLSALQPTKMWFVFEGHRKYGIPGLPLKYRFRLKGKSLFEEKEHLANMQTSA